MEKKEIIAPHLKAYDQSKFIEKVRRIITDADTTQGYVAKIAGRDPARDIESLGPLYVFRVDEYID